MFNFKNRLKKDILRYWDCPEKIVTWGDVIMGLIPLGILIYFFIKTI
jgi:hypothetical protein